MWSLGSGPVMPNGEISCVHINIPRTAERHWFVFIDCTYSATCWLYLPALPWLCGCAPQPLKRLQSIQLYKYAIFSYFLACRHLDLVIFAIAESASHFLCTSKSACRRFLEMVLPV